MRQFGGFAIAHFVAWLALAATAASAVSPEVAERLKSDLTPMGAERSGNAEGTIPAWTGGIGAPPSGYAAGAPRADPFAGEKSLFAITAANFETFAAKLPEGQKALFAKFADYRMDVYPTHRSAAAPAAVYANVYANATRAKAVPEGIAYGVSGAVGGVPFPVPGSGAEVVWNHLLAFWGIAREDRMRTYVVSSDGTLELTNAYREIVDFPYYYVDASPQSVGKYYFKRREISEAPASLAGRAYLLWQPLDAARDPVSAWQYLPRERRVRRSPALTHDTPTPDGGGIESFDDYYLFSGSPDRYDFRLVGKAEMYIPYNNNRLPLAPVAKVAGPQHANPDLLRYELHRVWVVDATLAAGKRHLAPHRRFYLDEDTWFIVYGDAWDADGRLWKFSQAAMYLVSDLPAVVPGSQFVYDLVGGGYVLAFCFNEEAVQYKPTPPHKESDYSPDTLAAEGVRPLRTQE
jgi:hypothetical protein